MLVILNWIGTDDLDLSVDAPDRDTGGANDDCLVGNFDDSGICDSIYPNDDTDAPGIEIVEFTNPVPGEYRVLVRKYSTDGTAQFTVTVFAPDFGTLVLTDPTIQTLTSDDAIPTEYPEFFTTEFEFTGPFPGVILTFTLPEPTAA
jgi:uncharacterized protein YfaP (DUF2135 family)